jgi:hypothetical protein
MSLTSIVLVGAPGTHREELALALAKELGSDWDVAATKDFSWLGTHHPKLSKFSLGPITDYRVELSLALWRAFRMNGYRPTIFADSVLDNLAHSCVYGADSIEAGNPSEIQRNVLLSGMLYTLVQDSFRADLVFFIPFDGETEDGFAEQLDKLYPDLFEQFGLTPIYLSGTLEEQLSKIMENIG